MHTHTHTRARVHTYLQRFPMCTVTWQISEDAVGDMFDIMQKAQRLDRDTAEKARIAAMYERENRAAIKASATDDQILVVSVSMYACLCILFVWLESPT